MKKASLLLSLFLLTACREDTAKPAYFPLNEGWTWHYEVKKQTASGIEISQFSVQNLSPISIEDQKLGVRRTSFGTEYFIKSTERAIERVGKRTIVQPHMVKDAPALPILTYPITIGTGWGHETPLFILQKKGDQFNEAEPLIHDNKILMNFILEEIDQEIETPAGKFTGCLKVIGQAQRNLFVDADKGFVDIPITQIEWYCKEAGLVKLERLEPLEAAFFSGGSLTYNLAKLEKP